VSNTRKISSHEEALEAGVDGYIDAKSGFFVFTSAYHLARGACCGNSCRHCPFNDSEA
jgi:hypothetical protein